MRYESTLTQRNLVSSHLYLTPFRDRLPADVIGGHTKDDLAPRTLTLEFGGIREETDIPTYVNGRPRTFFRNRTFARRFLDASRAEVGDVVLYDHVSPYHLRLSLRRKDGTIVSR